MDLYGSAVNDIRICEPSTIPAIGVRNSSAGHLNVVAAEEEQQRVARQADGVGDEHELHGALGPQLEPLQQAAAHEYADARAWDCYRPWKNNSSNTLFLLHE